MGTYYIPRNVKGEGRILYIFSTKALIYSVAGAGIGFIFYLIFKLLGMPLLGFIIVALLGLIGFLIGTFKFPKIGSNKKFNDIAGENIDDIIKRYISFRKNKNRIYIYTKEEEEK